MLRRKDALHTKSLNQSGLPLPGFGFEKQICSVSLPPVRKSQSRHNSHEMNLHYHEFGGRIRHDPDQSTIIVNFLDN